MAAWRAGIYARVSTQEQTKGQSIDTQIYYLRKYAGEQRWKVTKVHKDLGKSGGKEDRPGLKRLLKDVSAHRIDLVLCASTDRLARDLELAFSLMRRILGCGVRILFLNQSNLGIITKESLDDPQVLLPLRIFTTMDESQRTTTKWKTKQALNKLKEEGRRLGKPPLGFKFNKKTHKLKPDGDLALTIWNLRKKGWGATDIANRVNSEGLAEEFDRYKVHRVLNTLKKEPELLAMVRE